MTDTTGSYERLREPAQADATELHAEVNVSPCSSSLRSAAERLGFRRATASRD